MLRSLKKPVKSKDDKYFSTESGKPKFTEAIKLDNNCIKDELKKLYTSL